MKAFKVAKIIICALLVAGLFSGCMDTHHLRDLIIVEGIGIDREADDVRVYIQSLNVAINSSSEGLKGNMTIVTDRTGDSISDAVTGISKTLSKNLFFGQNKLIIFGRDVAENDFEKRLDYFLRSANSRADVAICVSDTTAKDIIESDENNALVPCENILYLLQNSEKTGLGACVDTNEVLNLYTDKTSCVYLPVVERGNDEKSVSVKGIGLFDFDNKMTYVTNDTQTLGFLILKNKLTSAVVEVEDGSLGKVSVNVTKIKAKNETQIKDGNVIFVSKINASIMINEIENGVVTKLDEDKLNAITSLVERELCKTCQSAFEACQLYSSDSIRVGKQLAKDNPSSYELLSDNWQYYFKSVKLSCSANVKFKKISDNTYLQ